jgi:hypothetical protein
MGTIGLDQIIQFTRAATSYGMKDAYSDTVADSIQVKAAFRGVRAKITDMCDKAASVSCFPRDPSRYGMHRALHNRHIAYKHPTQLPYL